MPPMRLNDLERAIELLRTYPITEVRKRTKLSFGTLAKIAKIHLKDE